MIRNYLRQTYRMLVPLLYARTNYKLFLQGSLADVDARLRQLAVATDLFSSVIRPVPIRPPFGEFMLVVAPHQDDEIIGCGGALLLHLRTGHKAAVVVVQDGGDEHDTVGMSREELVRQRNAESSRVASALHIETPRFLGHPDLARAMAVTAGELRDEILLRHADTVFAPFVLDHDRDHRLVNQALADALRTVPHDVRVFGYEVWGLTIPNVIVVIDEVMEQKRAALAHYEFANRAVDYVHATTGLNMYHSRWLPAGTCKYAERFFEMPGRDYVALVDALRDTGYPG